VSSIAAGFRIGEVPVPVRYMPEASSIGFRRSVVYGLSTLATVGEYWLHASKLRRSPRFAFRDAAPSHDGSRAR
jgi:hypothetical protein